jgi:hypothetical protein
MDRQKGKKTNNSVWRERQEDRQLRMDKKTSRHTTQHGHWTERQEDKQLSTERKARRQTTQNGQKSKKTGNSGLTERPRRMTTLYRFFAVTPPLSRGGYSQTLDSWVPLPYTILYTMFLGFFLSGAFLISFRTKTAIETYF